MTYTIGTAAKATGKAKSTISRDVKDGKISATKNDDGSFSIDPAELHRVYPAVSDNGSGNGEENDSQPMENIVGTGGLQAEVQRLRERLANSARALEQTEGERQRERHQLQSEIEFLRSTLKTEGEERRKLTAVLTDQRPLTAQGPQKEATGEAENLPRGGLWGRLVGKIGRTG